MTTMSMRTCATRSPGWTPCAGVTGVFSTDNGDTIVINPAISAKWPKCRLTYRLPDGKTSYDITIENPAGKEHGVTAATCDDRPAVIAEGAARIPLARDGQSHRVLVRL